MSYAAFDNEGPGLFEVEGDTSKLVQRLAFIYVVLYEVGQQYGGPEEGGWWYDVGDPIAAIPVHTEAEEAVAVAFLKAHFNTERRSVSVRERFRITRSGSWPESYPAETPHYE